MERLKGKFALVTAAGQGIGRAKRNPFGGRDRVGPRPRARSALDSAAPPSLRPEARASASGYTDASVIFERLLPSFGPQNATVPTRGRRQYEND